MIPEGYSFVVTDIVAHPACSQFDPENPDDLYHALVGTPPGLAYRNFVIRFRGDEIVHYTLNGGIALQLCEEGRLALDVPITVWLAGEVAQRIPFSERLTLRHLLSHTSGLSDYMNDDTVWRSDFVTQPGREWSHGDVLPYLYYQPLLFAPGSGYHYSNSNYILAGLIIERVSGRPLHKLIRESLLEPLGLSHTFNGREAITGRRRAHGYISSHGRVIDTYPWYSRYGLADSGLHSTPAGAQPADFAATVSAPTIGPCAIGRAVSHNIRPPPSAPV